MKETLGEKNRPKKNSAILEEIILPQKEMKEDEKNHNFGSINHGQGANVSKLCPVNIKGGSITVPLTSCLTGLY